MEGVQLDRGPLSGQSERLSERAWEGVTRFVEHYVSGKVLDTVVVAYTPDSREPAAWVTVALRECGYTVAALPMRPLVDADFRDRLTQAVPVPDEVEGRVFLLTFERETMSHTGLIRDVLGSWDPGRCKVIRAISAGRELFENAFIVSPAELSARNTSLLERLQTARTLRITTAVGTDLHVALDNERFRWISNRGVWRPGKVVIVPAGEVATFPASISGQFVADFALNVNMSITADARLDRTPVTLRIEEGVLVDFHCTEDDTSDFLSECLARPNAQRVGELGFGTNAGIELPIAMNSHTNERRPGVHLGFGQHNQRDGSAGYTCDVHLDLIARGGIIQIDDSPELLDLERVTPSLHPHPPVYDEEDVLSPDVLDGDCCGTYRSL